MAATGKETGSMPEPDTEEWRAHWRTIEESCERILRYVEDRDARAFESDDRTYDAVVRNLEIIEHAAASLPPYVRQRLSHNQLRNAARFDDVVADSVERDNRASAWRVATEEVRDLLTDLREADLEELARGAEARTDAIGRNAQAPGQIPRKGWRDVSIRVWYRLFDDYVFIVAAGVGFYGLLSVFPALATLVSTYGLLFDAADVNEQIRAMATLLPPEAATIIREQLTRLVENPDTTLSISVLVSFLITLWSARAGVGALMMAMNIAFREREKRGMIAWYAWSLLLTVGAIVYGVVALALVVALPAVLSTLGLNDQTWLALLRWPVLAVSTMLALTIIYRYGPSRRPARWTWVTWGSVGATVMWLLSSLLFSVYIANFGNFNELYGSMGAVIILMLWFYVTALIILLGAEFDAEMEHQTWVDSTIGPPRPLGERGAYMADTVGPRP